jgi:hypothetical protein
MHTCLDEKASIRRRPIPMVWLDQRRPLLGIMLCSCNELVAKYFRGRTKCITAQFVLASCTSSYQHNSLSSIAQTIGISRVQIFVFEFK